MRIICINVAFIKRVVLNYSGRCKRKMNRRRVSKRELERREEEARQRDQEEQEQKRRRREELGIKLPEPLKPWGSIDTLSKKVVPYFEKGEHPLIIAKKLNLNPHTVRSYWWRWRKTLGI